METMETYLDFLLKEDSTTTITRQKINDILEKGKQILGDNIEFNIWLNKSASNFDRNLFDDHIENVYLDFLGEEIDRLAQGYCV